VETTVRTPKPPASDLPEGMLGQCSLCSSPIAFSHFGKLDRPTGWAWFNGPDTHLQPICARCHSLHKRRTEQS
jgi:hypothetical protein